MTEARCATCRYWAGGETTRGECRRSIPTVYFVAYGNVADCGPSSEWPTSRATDWCGEYAERETLGAAGIPWRSNRAVYFPSEAGS